MDHTHIINAGNLERYANNRNSQAVIPELVYWLVNSQYPTFLYAAFLTGMR